MASAEAKGCADRAAMKEKWKKEQKALQKQIVLENDLPFDPNTFEGLKYVGGADVSFVRDDAENACIGLVVLSYPGLELVHCSCSMVKLTLPYIPGYLAFREGSFIKEKLDRLKRDVPKLVPQILFLDGNGLLHSRGAGLACHVGVENDIPCIGVAKTLFCTHGIAKDATHRKQIESLKAAGDSFPLVGDRGDVLGRAVLTGVDCKNPVYVSVGHRVSLDTAVELTLQCSKFRVPEPTRMADMKSRKYIRDHFELSKEVKPIDEKLDTEKGE